MEEIESSNLDSQENISNTLQDSKFSSSEDLILSNGAESDPFSSKSEIKVNAKKSKASPKVKKRTATKKTITKTATKKPKSTRKVVKKESQTKTTKRAKVTKVQNEPTKQEIKSLVISLNKPFSLQEITIYFKSAITKTPLQKILNELENEGIIVSKMYSKTTIYCTKQNEVITNEDDIRKLELKLTDLKQEQDGFKQLVNELTGKLNYITKYPSDDNLLVEIEGLNQTIVILNKRIDALKGGEQISEIEMSKVELNLKGKNQKLKEIKQVFYNILDSLCEGLNLKRNALLEKLEMEL